MLSRLPSVTYASLEESGMPAPLKSQMRSWIDRTLAANGSTPESARSLAKLHAVAAIEGVRATAEGAAFGAMLGATHAMLPNGLDVKLPSAKMNLPLDGVGAVVGMLAGVFLAQEAYGVGRTATQAGAACASVFAFRKTNDLVDAMNQKRAGITAGGGAHAGNAKQIGKEASFAGDPYGTQFGADFDPIAYAARTL